MSHIFLTLISTPQLRLNLQVSNERLPLLLGQPVLTKLVSPPLSRFLDPEGPTSKLGSVPAARPLHLFRCMSKKLKILSDNNTPARPYVSPENKQLILHINLCQRSLEGFRDLQRKGPELRQFHSKGNPAYSIVP